NTSSEPNPKPLNRKIQGFLCLRFDPPPLFALRYPRIPAVLEKTGNLYLSAQMAFRQYFKQALASQ
ncbi:hypothetical protein, partial [Pseudomonas moraviensis]